MAVRWLGCDCEVLGVCWTVASGCSCVCGCFQYACHPPVIGLDIQDDMGRHEVGFQGDIAKIPVNDDSKSLLAVIIFLLLLSPVPPSPPPPPLHTHTGGCRMEAKFSIKKVPLSPLLPSPYITLSPLRRFLATSMSPHTPPVCSHKQWTWLTMSTILSLEKLDYR